MHFPVAPARVFAALDSDQGRASFWAESAVERNGVIEFRFVSGYVHAGRILQRRPPYVWAIEYFGAEARFELADDGRGGTDLLLTHTGLQPGEWQEVHAGWLNVLFPLKAWLVHGVELRNRDPQRSWEQGFADQ
jgi:hypothetical protein